MKLIKFINYDINEGIFRFWKRYLLVILFGIITCTMCHANKGYYLKLYGVEWSSLEYGVNEFWGREPFHYDPNLAQAFIVPFEWILVYLMLAYCIGSYIDDDMKGFGTQLMIKSKKRLIWWVSKCVWCILVNVAYFGLLWGVNIGYAWIIGGDISFTKHESVLTAYYGSLVSGTEIKDLVIILVLLTFMAGLVQSLFQIICVICFGSVTSMIILSGILVVSCYYSHPLLVHGYAMLIRYYPDGVFPEYKPLNYQVGLVYLMIDVFLLGIIGYGIIRRKNILEKR